MSTTDKERPAYRVLAIHGFYGPDDHLYQEGDEIYFDGVPNEELEPLNESARDRMIAFLEELDRKGREVSEKTGKMYVGRARSLDGALEMATAVQRAEMAIMSAPKQVTTIARLTKQEASETGSPLTGRRRGRPKLIRDTAA